MGSYAMPPGRTGQSDRTDGDRAKLGDLLSGRLSDIDVDSVEAIREERERE